MKEITLQEAWKLNLLNLVKEHREKCDKTCAVSLSRIWEIAQAAGLEFTEDEALLFV